MSTELERGTGRSSSQLKGALEGSIYIVKFEAQVPNFKFMAEKLGRSDLAIKTVGWLMSGSWRGTKIKGVVVDHHALEEMSLAEHSQLNNLQTCVRN